MIFCVILKLFYYSWSGKVAMTPKMKFIAVVIMIFWNFDEITSVEIISITPSSTCLTTGLTNVVATAAFEQQAIISSCTWVYGGPLQGTQFYTAAFGCARSISNLGDTVTCSKQNIDGVPHLNTTLTIGNPLSAGILSLGISCSSINASSVVTPPTITRMVAGCDTSSVNILGGTVSCPGTCNYNSAAALTCQRGNVFSFTCQADCTFGNPPDMSCTAVPIPKTTSTPTSTTTQSTALHLSVSRSLIVGVTVGYIGVFLWTNFLA